MKNKSEGIVFCKEKEQFQSVVEKELEKVSEDNDRKTGSQWIRLKETIKKKPLKCLFDFQKEIVAKTKGLRGDDREDE